MDRRTTSPHKSKNSQPGWRWSSAFVSSSSPRNPYHSSKQQQSRNKQKTTTILWIVAVGLCLWIGYRVQWNREEQAVQLASGGGRRPAHWLQSKWHQVASQVTTHVQHHLRGMDATTQSHLMTILHHAVHEQEEELAKGNKAEQPKEENQDPTELERMKQAERTQARRQHELVPLMERNNADRHIHTFLKIVQDCQNPVIDLNDPTYTTERAVELFTKCRILIFKHAYNPEFLKEYRQDYAGYLLGLKEGTTSRHGSNSGGDNIFVAGRGRGRYEILLPERLARAELVNNRRIVEVVQHPRVLGRDMALRSLNSLVSEGNQGGGTPGQPWHFDEGFVFGQEHGGLQHFGLAGHDVPPFCVSMAVPLLDLDRTVGPTEFCVGSSALNGVHPQPAVVNTSWTEPGSLFHQYFEFPGHCPAACWISPLLELGDAVVWDYGLKHRGGWNASPKLRSILLLLYAKTWYDDTNFGDKTRHHKAPDEDPELTHLLSRTRFATPIRDDPLEHAVTTPLTQLSLTQKKKNQPQHHQPPSPQLDAEPVDWLVTNQNVQGQDPVLYINDVPQGPLPIQASRWVSVPPGSVVQLRDNADGRVVLGQFVTSTNADDQDPGQFVFTQDAAARAAASS